MAATGSPTPEELQQRWVELVDALGEAPRDLDLLQKAGALSEQLGRRLEAYTYTLKAAQLDPTRRFLIPKLQSLASTPEQIAEVAKLAKRPPSFRAALGDVFKYPVRGKGLPVLILGSVVFGALRALSSGGIYGLGVGGLVGAYLTMFYVDMCHTTVAGEDELPDWPDPLRLQEFAVDVFKMALPILVSFLPAFLLLFWMNVSAPEPGEASFQVSPAASAEADDDEEVAPKAGSPATAPAPKRVPAAPAPPLLKIGGLIVFGILGLIYLPMATLANIIYGSPWACLNAPFVARSIASTMGDYALCLLTTFAASIAVGALEFGARVGGVVLVSGFALAFVSMYGMAVQMRILGHFYRMNQARLGWLRD